MTQRCSLILLITAILAAFSGSINAVELKISTMSPDGSFWMQELRKSANKISKKTGNRVKFKFYPGGIMGDGNTVLRKMRFGQLHGATLTNASLSRIYPDIQLYNLILKFQSPEEVDFVRQRMDDQLLKGLEAKKLVPMGFAEIGFAYLMSTIPIASIDDMKNQKAWVPDTNYVAQIALDAFPVARIPLPIRDVLVALQTGMVNIVPGSPVAALALQWHTKLKYLTELPLSYVFGVMIIDNKAFKKISKADRLIVREVMGRAMNDISQHNRKDNVNAMSAINNQGVEFITPDKNEATELRHMIKSANEKLMTSGKLSRSLVDEFNQHLNEYRSQALK